VDRCAYQPLKDGDEAALAAGRAFARESLFERLWLHAALELPPLLARSEVFTAQWRGRTVGLAAASDGLFPFRVAALDAALPGVAAELLAALPAPFVCRVPARLARELERAGARPIRRERQMVRLAPIADDAPLDPRIERLSDPAELTRFLGRDFAPLELELAPFLGIRDPFGEKGPSVSMEVSLPGRFLIFVRPSSIVGHSLPFENSGIGSSKTRIIYHDQYHFPFHIDSRIVVPVIFRCHDSISGEYKFILVE
jgi:hypothetical protein